MLFPFLASTFQAESLYAVDFDALAAKGYRGLILDIDNTLVPHDAPADKRCLDLLDSLKKRGIRMVILSNNHEPRANSFAAAVKLPYICEAGKPSPGKYPAACEKLGLQKGEIICVGDQLFTDIWGANNAGLDSLLVEPLDPATDTAWIRIKRVPEKAIKYLHNKNNTGKISRD